MHTVSISIVTSSQSFPIGTVASGIKITMGDFDPVVAPAAPYSAMFSNVPAGDYTVTAQAVDESGNALGDAITAPVTVGPDVVNIDIPASISVQIS